jgi:hypothetical protein
MSKNPKVEQAQAERDEAPQYRVTAPSYVAGLLVGPGMDHGDTVFYSGKPGKYLEPLNDAAKKAKADAAKKPAPAKADKADPKA